MGPRGTGDSAPGSGEAPNKAVAVGTRLTPRPPRRSERALLTHSAPALDV
jgi:hypothetical protein